VSHDVSDGMVHLGYVAEPEQKLLRRVLEGGRGKLAAAWRASAAKREIFWINLWRGSSNEEPIALAGVAEVDRWVRELVNTAYAGEGVELEGYGFIINPVESKSQLWHVDYYTMDYSNLFIPLTPLTPENCTQYAVLPPGTPLSARQALAKLEFVDVNGLIDSFDYVSVRQMLARPFSILKMDFGAIHRGIANKSGFERILFWISVTRGDVRVPEEGAVEIFDPLS
jgi:hypothetical protein